MLGQGVALEQGGFQAAQQVEHMVAVADGPVERGYLVFVLEYGQVGGAQRPNQ